MKSEDEKDERNDFPKLTPEAIAQGYREVTEEERRALPDIFRRNGVPEPEDEVADS